MESRNMIPTISVTEPQTEAGKRRAERIRQMGREHRAPSWWALKARAEADKPLPSREVRDSPLGVWVEIWDRPVRRDAGPLTDAAFDALVEDYDRHTERNRYFAEQRKKREAAEAKERQEREAQDTARREAEAQQLKAELRGRYLRLPGTTAAEFEREYPSILAEQRRQQMAATETDLQRELRSIVWRAMHEAD